MLKKISMLLILIGGLLSVTYAEPEPIPMSTLSSSQDFHCPTPEKIQEELNKTMREFVDGDDLKWAFQNNPSTMYLPQFAQVTISEDRTKISCEYIGSKGSIITEAQGINNLVIGDAKFIDTNSLSCSGSVEGCKFKLSKLIPPFNPTDCSTKRDAADMLCENFKSMCYLYHKSNCSAEYEQCMADANAAYEKCEAAKK